MDHERMRRLHDHSMAGMKRAAFEVALKDRTMIATETMVFVLEKPDGFTFRAGQHIRMTLLEPTETDSEGDSRFFSLACTPQDGDLVIAMRMRDTAFKRGLRSMPIGTKVRVEILLGVPHGAFALHTDPAKPAVMLAGGIGIVPAYAMIKDATERRLPHLITLIYANRTLEDATYLGELQAIEKQNPNFTLVATMTKPQSSSMPWSGETGHIDGSMIQRHVKSPRVAIYYVAGLPDMTEAMKTVLKGLGVKPKAVLAEAFSGFNMGAVPMKRRNAWPKVTSVVLIGVAILVAILAHVGILTALLPQIREHLNLRNPAIYAIAGTIALVILLKLKFVFGGGHSRR